MVNWTKEEEVAKEVLTDEVMDSCDRGENSAPVNHTSPHTNQMVPSSSIPSSVSTEYDCSQSRFDIDPHLRDVERDVGPMDKQEEVCIDEQNTAKVIKIRKNVEVVVRTQLVEFLQRKLDVFAWSHKDMVRISPTLISHVLNVDKNYPAVQQKLRLLDKER